MAANPAAGGKDGKDGKQPIIVIKRYKKGGHGSHGGAWKIAYADFVTAMMAFFLLMWVLGSTTSGDLAGISAYFQNPLRVTLSGGQGSGDATRIIKGGGESIFRTVGQEARADADTAQRRVSDSQTPDLEEARLVAAKQAQGLKETIEKEIARQAAADPAIQEVRNQIFMDVTSDGLRVQIVDQQNRSTFDVGGTTMTPAIRALLRTIGRIVGDMGDGTRIRVEGHTDSRRFGNGPAGYGNWELSAERANAARRELVSGGLPDTRIAQVVGFADSMRLNPDDANDPQNRRISLMIQGAAGKRPVAGSPQEGVDPVPAGPRPSGSLPTPSLAAQEAINGASANDAEGALSSGLPRAPGSFAPGESTGANDAPPPLQSLPQVQQQPLPQSEPGAVPRINPGIPARTGAFSLPTRGGGER